MSVIVDFTSDWKKFMEDEISSQGYSVDANEDIHKISYRFFNLRKRHIAPVRRAVHESIGFSCPANLQNGYDILKAKLQTGQDVYPHLSKFLLKDDYEDSLLNDWGIHHLHLGVNPEKSGFIERTGPLLFAHVTADSVYCLGIYPHGSWTQQDLIRVIHDNWPSVIAAKKINGVVGLSHIATDSDIAALRKAGVQTMIQLEPGVVYAPLGGGYSTAGTSIESTMRSDWYMRLIRNLEDHVKENLDKFTTRIRDLGHSHGNPPTFSLMVNEQGFFAVEVAAGVAFLLHAHVSG